jgi:opacity protein-like surface antigen
MKRVIIGLVLALATAQTASADVYVKVDANGNAIGGAIMCDAATCGAGSLYSQLTLNPGESYVLQGVGVHHGIGNNNPGVDVKHEAATNEWVVTNNNTPAPVVERFTVNTPAPVVQVPAPTAPVDTKTVTIDTSTVVFDTATVLSDTTTVMSLIGFDWSAFWVQFEIWFKTFFTNFWGLKP